MPIAYAIIIFGYYIFWIGMRKYIADTTQYIYSFNAIPNDFSEAWGEIDWDGKYKNIKMLAMDVDGTLTDGKIYYGSKGEIFKAFDVRDGYRLIKCREYGIITAIITGKTSKIVEGRAKDLKIAEVHQNVPDKINVLKHLMEKYGLKREQVAYIGDDVNDIECLWYCGFSACPKDALEEVKNSVDYVCNNIGGHGAVREIIDLIIG